MAHKPVSSSERKGILIVAAVALCVTVSGLCVAWCGRPEKVITREDVEVLVAGDSVAVHDSDDSPADSTGTAGSILKKDGGKLRKVPARRKPQPRSPLDEVVSQ